MVLGRKPSARTRRSSSVRLDYLITIEEIKPWPPSPLLGSLRLVVIQWENGERSSGCTRSVVPGPISDLSDGTIEFNESFRLPVVLLKDTPAKAGNGQNFLKNYLVLNLYEPRRESIAKGQLIATAVIDLADYGIVDEPLRVRAPMNCKRNFRNMVQPYLYVEIQPSDKTQTCSSSCGSLSKELPVAENDTESITALANEEYAEEAEISAFREEHGSSPASAMAASFPSKSNGIWPTEDQQVKLDNGIFSPNFAVQLEENEMMDTRNDRYGETGIEEHDFLDETHSVQDGTTSLLAGASDEPATGAFSFSWGKFEMKDDVLTRGNLEHVKSVEPSSDDAPSNGFDSSNQMAEECNEVDGPREKQLVRLNRYLKTKEAKVHPVERRNTLTDAKVQHLQRRIQILEAELREVAVLEVSLYSVVAEHGSATGKIHAPARRLSRLYRHAYQEYSQSRRASAARNTLSGLILVAKACGNDVPRLTFWLSNSVMLRAILSRTITKGSLKMSSANGSGSFLSSKANKSTAVGNREELQNFLGELEKVEAWIFSRIVESVWWQILIPHMQSAAAKRINQSKLSISHKGSKRVAQAEEELQVNISLDIWKKAFKDACERLCPVRSGGQKCGCLSVLGRLVMEQCVARLDVAMFNALLRESADDIPTDPLSDPISDPKVLPIPAGKSSFKAGAQLKNVIGSWTRWLTDLFGMNDDESGEHLTRCNTNKERRDEPFESFRLLNMLSDLMMLPKDLLLNESTRKEVCPTLSASLIKRVLQNFVPDEFCPDPIAEAVLEALNSEDPPETGEELISVYPCIAAPPVYSPPPADTISGIIGNIGAKSRLRSHGSFIIKKAQNSDDELDEVSSPLASISIYGCSSSPVSTIPSSVWKETGNRSPLRYELLRDIWMDAE